jgi:hypothetical protein
MVLFTKGYFTDICILLSAPYFLIMIDFAQITCPL